MEKIFQTALKIVIADSKETQTEIAKTVGISVAYLNDLLHGRRNGAENIRRRIADVFGYCYEAFLDVGRQALGLPSEAEGFGGDEFEAHELDIDLENYIAVPFHKTMSLSAGNGGRIPAPDDDLGNPVMLYRPELGRKAKHDLRAFPVGGDSMEPTIPAGGIVVVDLDDKQLINNKIFMIKPDPYEEECAVKRIAATNVSEKVLLISDNPQYPPKSPRGNWTDIVIGKVIWYWKKVD